MTNINFSDAITSIDANAFWECKNLAKLYMNRETPPFVDKSTFYRTNAGLIIYVPKGCRERFKNSEGWRAFNIVEME